MQNGVNTEAKIDVTNYPVSPFQMSLPFMDLMGLSEDQISALKTAATLFDEDMYFATNPLEERVEAVVNRLGEEILSRAEVTELLRTADVPYLAEYFSAQARQEA